MPKSHCDATLWQIPRAFLANSCSAPAMLLQSLLARLCFLPYLPWPVEGFLPQLMDSSGRR